MYTMTPALRRYEVRWSLPGTAIYTAEVRLTSKNETETARGLVAASLPAGPDLTGCVR